MKRLSFLFLAFILFSIPAFSRVTLPSHFGQEVKVVVISPPISQELDFVHNDWTAQIDVSSSDFFDETLFVTATASLSQTDSGSVGVSIFYKINDFMFIGGATKGKSLSLDLSHTLTFLYSYKTGNNFIEPFIHVRLNDQLDIKGVKSQAQHFGGGGVRYVRDNKLSLEIALEMDDKNAFHFMAGVGAVWKTKRFGLLNTVFKKADDAIKQKK